MNRISRDSTAPRRLRRKRGELRRSDESLVAAEAELIHPTMATIRRSWPFG
jgi:hypothetical protein